jgi:hypothetical protein
MKGKLIAALAAVSLVTAPAVAQAPRALAPVSGTASELGGESFLPWAILIGIVAGATLLVVNEEDNDNDPLSP